MELVRMEVVRQALFWQLTGEEPEVFAHTLDMGICVPPCGPLL
jgi:hypothetical protein